MGYKLSLEEVRLEFEKDGYKLLSTEYHGVHKHLEYICICGKTENKSLKVFRRNPKCTTCLKEIQKEKIEAKANETKICTECSETKIIKDFYRQQDNIITNICRICHAKPKPDTSDKNCTICHETKIITEFHDIESKVYICNLCYTELNQKEIKPIEEKVLETKICTKCKETKNITEFHKNRNKIFDICKACPKKDKIVISEEKKTCNTCNVLQSISNYHKGTNKCKDCSHTSATEYLNTFKGFMNKLYRSAKGTAKNRTNKGRIEAGEFTITEDDIVDQWNAQNGLCYYSKMQMFTHTHHDWQCSLERKDTTKGYIKENIALVCLEFNCGVQWSHEKVERIFKLISQNTLYEYKPIDFTYIRKTSKHSTIVKKTINSQNYIAWFVKCLICAPVLQHLLLAIKG